jgi:hypothetical protein
VRLLVCTLFTPVSSGLAPPNLHFAIIQILQSPTQQLLAKRS